MSEELKTLKDLDFRGLEFRERRASEYLVEQIRQEAIKWFRADQKIIDETTTPAIRYALKNMKKIWMKRLNITEEDLK